jgi:hypothetical protein
MAEINGASNSVVAEVGAQLAWLGAALRSSLLELGLACCTPEIIDICEDESSITFRIGFSFTKREGSSNKQWHKMFRSLVVVEDYPILLRTEPTGLEILLEIIAALVGRSQVNV